MGLTEAWASMLQDSELQDVVETHTSLLSRLVAEQGWSQSLVDSLAPLFLARHFSQYDHVYLSHPGLYLPYEEDSTGYCLLPGGVILIGFAPNGDYIAVDAVRSPGAVLYISHEEVDFDDIETLHDVSGVVASSVAEYLLALHNETAPLDYYEL